MKKNYSSSSIFSLRENDFDDRNNKRNLIYNEALEDIRIQLEYVLSKYCDEDIVTRRSLEEYLLKELLINYREREGY